MSSSRVSGQILSVLFHPLLILTYGLILILAFNPYAFGVANVVDKLPLILICLAYTFLLPLVSIIFMVFIGLIESMQMIRREERIGPLIICIVFYTWFYINMHRNSGIPAVFGVYTLGSVVALSLAFFITVFSKISLHSVALGGLSGIVLVMLWHFGYQGFEFMGFHVHIKLVLMLSLILSGLIGSVRLWLEAHTNKDVFGGFLVGIASQFIALQILL
jgi:hypothetical protein